MSSQNSPEVYVPSEIYPPDAANVVYFARPKQGYWLHVLLLCVTVFTTLVVGSQFEWNYLQGRPPFSREDSIFPLSWALQNGHLLLGIPFSLTLMLILLAHEMGHYLYCLRYQLRVTLPFFIPFPTLFGTMGAFIRIRSPLRSRVALFDIGIAGPIAGFVVALPILIFSLGLSRVAPFGAAPADIQLGYPLVFHVVHKLLMMTRHASAIGAVPLDRIYLHPVAIAAWVGMFATSLNLLPGGQLDGGHVLFAVSPATHGKITRGTILALIPMAVYFWTGWLVWAVFLRLSLRHPTVPHSPEITAGRRWLALVAILLLVLTITPAPIAQQSLFDVLPHWPGIR